MCYVDPEWKYNNEIYSKFPLPNDYKFIDFVGLDFIGRIRRIYTTQLVQEYSVSENTFNNEDDQNEKNNTFIEIIVSSPLNIDENCTLTEHPVLTYISGDDCQYDELYMIGDKVKYYASGGLIHIY